MHSLPMNLVARAVRAALLEDLGPGDLTCSAVVPRGSRAQGVITAGEPLVLAGIEAARLAFSTLDPWAAFTRQSTPGEPVAAGGVLLEVAGDAAAILSAERTALNFLAWLSGIATLTSRCVQAVAGTGAAVYDTRKTTPGLRFLEKHAVALGGGRNHRQGLHDAVLIKDNHLVLAGGPAAAVRAARARYGSSVTVEVELEDLETLEEVLAAGPDIILLDNMSPRDVARAVRSARERGGGVELEASGGITLGNIRAFAETGVNRISLGALTHSAPAASVSLALRPLGAAGP